MSGVVGSTVAEAALTEVPPAIAAHLKGDELAIHPTAIIDPKAEIDPSAEIGPYCVIDAHVHVGAGCRLYQNVFLTGWTQIGTETVLHPGVVIGHEPQDLKYGGERSYCRIGERTVIREYVSIHRGTEPDSQTVIGDDCFLLADSHVGHNCHLGRSVVLTSGAKLGGHVEIGDRAIIGGLTGIHQFVRVGELALVAGQAHVRLDVLPYAITDVEGHIAGLNRIGLRRAEVPAEDVRELREAYRVLFSSRLPFTEAVKKISENVQTARGKRLLDFLRADSRRGFAGSSRTRGKSADAPAVEK